MLDCDVDRAAIDGTTSKPEPVNRNRLVALAAQVALEDGNGVIVTDPVTSVGGRVHRGAGWDARRSRWAIGT